MIFPLNNIIVRLITNIKCVLSSLTKKKIMILKLRRICTFANMENSKLLIKNSKRSTKMVVYLTLSVKLLLNYLIHHLFSLVNGLEFSLTLEIPLNVYLVFFQAILIFLINMVALHNNKIRLILFITLIWMILPVLWKILSMV